MSRRRRHAILVVGLCLLAGGGAIEGAAPVVASAASSRTVPGQLTNQFPLGSQRLCCQSTTQSQAAAAPPARGTTSATPSGTTSATPSGTTGARSGSSGGMAMVIWIALGAAVVTLLAAGVAGVRRTRRTPALVPTPGFRACRRWRMRAPHRLHSPRRQSPRPTRRATASWIRAATPAAPSTWASCSTSAATLPELLRPTSAPRSGAIRTRGSISGCFSTRSAISAAPRPLGSAASKPDTPELRPTWCSSPIATGSRRAVTGPARSPAMRPAEKVTGGARSVRRWSTNSSTGALTNAAGPGGAFNLGVVLHQRGDVTGAMAAYRRAERRGDPDAAFNLGVLLYEAGDFDGAEASWQRSVQRGNSRATQNLDFLAARRRRERETAGSAPTEATGERRRATASRSDSAASRHWLGGVSTWTRHLSRQCRAVHELPLQTKTG